MVPMICPDCHRLEHDLRLTREALTLCEAALAASQAKVEQLRAQMQRIQQRSGIAPAYRLSEFAERAGVEYLTIFKWKERYSDYPRPVNGTEQPPLYDVAEVEDFLRRHPRLGKREH